MLHYVPVIIPIFLFFSPPSRPPPSKTTHCNYHCPPPHTIVLPTHSPSISRSRSHALSRITLTLFRTFTLTLSSSALCARIVAALCSYVRLLHYRSVCKFTRGIPFCPPPIINHVHPFTRHHQRVISKTIRRGGEKKCNNIPLE